MIGIKQYELIEERRGDALTEVERCKNDQNRKLTAAALLVLLEGETLSIKRGAEAIREKLLALGVDIRVQTLERTVSTVLTDLLEREFIRKSVEVVVEQNSDNLATPSQKEGVIDQN